MVNLSYDGGVNLKLHNYFGELGTFFNKDKCISQVRIGKLFLLSGQIVNSLSSPSHMVLLQLLNLATAAQKQPQTIYEQMSMTMC